MGKEVRGDAEGAALGGEPPGIGHYLASQRRLRGISLDELCTLTRIPRRSLERLEAGVFDAAPDGFVRGFVRAVAGALGLDPDEAVMRLMREPEHAAEPVPGGPAGRMLLLGLGLALLLVLALAGVWQLASRDPAPEARAPESEVILRLDPVRALAADEPAAAPVPAPAGEPAPEPAPGP